MENAIMICNYVWEVKGASQQDYFETIFNIDPWPCFRDVSVHALEGALQGCLRRVPT